MQQALRIPVSGVEAIDSSDALAHAGTFRPAKKSSVTPQPAKSETRGLPLVIRDLRKSFGDNEVLRGIDLEIPAGQFVAIVGQSGCGKSTLLRLIAGLDKPTSGTISFGDAAARPEDVRVMFQEPRLLPWARVLANVEVGLGRDRKAEGAHDRARQALEEVGLADKREQWPAVLSGGQKQRVALARALITSPQIL
ncbi:ABC transporter ATP-binding protein, partial [Bradyrhizobium sp.]|uniref:ABC transporter ATP-binding protein n=1 Tax=Bradyrhizobium sp. TaxID=376 RepID=UPI00391A75E8